MTALKFDRLIRHSGGHHALGWTVAVLYHLIGFSGLLFCMSEIDKPVLLDTFHWEISMVEAPRKPELMQASATATPLPPQPYQVERSVDSLHPLETLQTVQHADHESVTPQVQPPTAAVPSE